MIRNPRNTSVVSLSSTDDPASDCAPPRIGAHVGPLSDVIRTRRGISGLGRLGAFAVKRSARDLATVYGLTCQHVLDVAEPMATVFQPRLLNGPHGSRLCEAHLNPIGRISNIGAEGNGTYALLGYSSQLFYVDCAAIEMRTLPNVGQAVRAGHASALDIAGRRRLRVRLFGVHDSPRGEVTDILASVTCDGHPDCHGTIVIETMPGHPPFARPGDSGALVVDQFDRAIGMLWGIERAEPERAFACHLLPALDRLGLVLLRRTSSTGAHKGAAVGTP